MNEHLTPLKQSLSNWAHIVQANTEQRIAKAMFVSALNSSSIGGAFSGWLLAISGATIGLAFSDVESLLNILSPAELRIAFGFLFASCAAGFAARIAGSYVDIYRQLSSELEVTIEAILREHALEAENIKRTAGSLVAPPSLEPDLQRAVAQFLECVPSHFRRLVIRSMAKGQADPLFIYKRATKIYFGQSIVVMGQAVLFALFVGTLFAAI